MEILLHDHVKTLIEKILPNHKNINWDLIPDSIFRLAESSGIAIDGQKEGWLESASWERYNCTNQEYIDRLFLDYKPSFGQTIAITDVIFRHSKEFEHKPGGFQFQFEELEYFVTEYRSRFKESFFQPACDMIFICPEVATIIVQHHESYIWRYKK